MEKQDMLISFMGNSIDFTQIMLIQVYNSILVITLTRGIEIKFTYDNYDEAEKARIELTKLVNKSYL